MLIYLIIILDETSVSYCHYEVTKQERSLISLEDLKAGILFGMKENLNIQFVYPDYPLPPEYDEAIDSVDHANIMSDRFFKDADILVLTNWKEQDYTNLSKNQTCMIRSTRKELQENIECIKGILVKVSRLNIVLTDICDFSDSEISEYDNWLNGIAGELKELFLMGKNVQLNLLTDRVMLSEMNNCNAGVNNITLAPNGKFYLCPAFYYDNPQNSVGDLLHGVDIRNKQLLKIDYAPICRHCDAFQCKRCVWMNERLTLDINTPSHQQCVIAHLERNSSRRMMLDLEKDGI